jgi:hypothetical protein
MGWTARWGGKRPARWVAGGGTPDDPSLPTVVCGHGVHVRGDIWPCRSLRHKPQRESDVWSTEWRGGGGAVRLSDGSDAGSPHGAVEMEQQAHMELFAGKNRGCRERKRERRAIIKVAHPRCLLRLLPRSARRDTWRARDREDANVRFPRRIHSIFLNKIPMSCHVLFVANTKSQKEKEKKAHTLTFVSRNRRI